MEIPPLVIKALMAHHRLSERDAASLAMTVMAALKDAGYTLTKINYRSRSPFVIDENS